MAHCAPRDSKEHPLSFTNTMQANQQQKSREEDYLDAQRATVEAILVGRETLQQATQQGEQLDRADAIADETQYTLDKAGRILRGMTWSGWVANMFTKDLETPKEAPDQPKQQRQPPLVYENLPETCRSAAQAVQNYHANVAVLEACETEDERKTCQSICESLHVAASKELKSLETSSNLEAYRIQLETDLGILRSRERRAQQRKEIAPVARKDVVIGAVATSSETDIVRQEQDKHLEFLSQNLGELGTIASHLNQAVGRQNETLERLDSKSDSILEQSKRVTRRADRLTQAKAWTTAKANYICRLAIRHVDSGQYLSIVDGDVYLVPRLGKTGIFTMWKRQGSLFGLKSKFTEKWVGQSLLGSLACSSSSFGRREEWEADDDWAEQPTTLLCASAGWGAGGYLMVRAKDHAVLIGGSGVEEKKKAARWRLQELNDDVS